MGSKYTAVLILRFSGKMHSRSDEIMLSHLRCKKIIIYATSCKYIPVKFHYYVEWGGVGSSETARVYLHIVRLWYFTNKYSNNK